MTNYLPRVALALLCAAPAFGAGNFIAPRVAVVPGGVATFRIPGGTEARPLVKYGERSVPVARQADGWIAILGLGLSTEPGDYHVDVEQPGASPRQLAFKVVPKQYAVQQLKVAPNQVNLSAEDEARVNSERDKVRAALETF